MNTDFLDHPTLFDLQEAALKSNPDDFKKHVEWTVGITISSFAINAITDIERVGSVTKIVAPIDDKFLAVSLLFAAQKFRTLGYSVHLSRTIDFLELSVGFRRNVPSFMSLSGLEQEKAAYTSRNAGETK